MLGLRLGGAGEGLGLGLALGADAAVAHGQRVTGDLHFPELAGATLDELEATHADHNLPIQDNSESQTTQYDRQLCAPKKNRPL